MVVRIAPIIYTRHLQSRVLPRSFDGPIPGASMRQILFQWLRHKRSHRRRHRPTQRVGTSPRLIREPEPPPRGTMGYGCSTCRFPISRTRKSPSALLSHRAVLAVSTSHAFARIAQCGAAAIRATAGDCSWIHRISSLRTGSSTGTSVPWRIRTTSGKARYFLAPAASCAQCRRWSAPPNCSANTG